MAIESIPHPLFEHLATLNRPPPGIHQTSFFDPPSGPIVNKAKSFIHSLLPPWAENHCYRTYASGLAIAEAAGWSEPGAEADRLGWNKDLWFLTAILHDIGWDEDCLQSRLSFEIYGGVKAREILGRWGVSQDDADEVCESIIRHTAIAHEEPRNGSIRLMGALLQLGVANDIMGAAVPAWMHPNDLQTIPERWPRLGIADQFATFIGHEITNKSGCMTTIWTPGFLARAPDIDAFKGMEGEARDDEEWVNRRKAISY